MGGFYGSVQVKTSDQAKVVAAAEKVAQHASIRCLVGPVLGEWVGVYPENSGQDQKVGELLAENLGGVVLHAMVHDDSVLAYWLWHDGQQADAFWSKPGYFGEENRQEEERMRGDAARLAELCGGDPQKLGHLLQEEESVFEMDRLDRLGKLLRIKNLVTSYEYLKEDGGSEGVTGFKKFREVPAAAVDEAKAASKRANAALAAQKKALKSAGLLIGEVTFKFGPYAMVCGMPNGFLVAETQVGPQAMVPGAKILRYQPPWKPETLPWDVRDAVMMTASDASGRIVALAQQKGAAVIDANQGAVLRHFVEPVPVFSLSLSADGRRLAYVTSEGTKVVDWESNTELSRLPEGLAVTIDSTGQWLLGRTREGEVGIYQVGSEQPRKMFFPGGRMESPGAALLSRKMAQFDIDAMERKQKQLLEQTLAKFDKLTSGRGKQAIHLDKEQLAAFRKNMEAQWAQQKAKLLQMKAGTYEPPVVPGEQVRDIGLSADTKWFWTTGPAGLKVYDFQHVLSSDPPHRPHWVFSPGGFVGYVTELRAGDLIISGSAQSQGKLWHATFAAGNPRELVTLPQGRNVYHLAVSTDGRFLAMQSQLQSGKMAMILEFWDLQKLLGSPLRPAGAH